jgi:hypothetical protein
MVSIFAAAQVSIQGGGLVFRRRINPRGFPLSEKPFAPQKAPLGRVSTKTRFGSEALAYR